MLDSNFWLAPRCDVTASQLDAVEAGPTSPVFFLVGNRLRITRISTDHEAWDFLVDAINSRQLRSPERSSVLRRRARCLPARRRGCSRPDDFSTSGIRSDFEA